MLTLNLLAEFTLEHRESFILLARVDVDVGDSVITIDGQLLQLFLRRNFI